MSVTHLRPEESPLTALINKYTAHLLNFDQLQTVPDPTWMIDKYISNDSVCVLWSDPGMGKSFLALDWALCVATNTDWFGNRVEPTNVLYVAGEGVSGIKKRVNAWVADHGIRPYDDQFVVLGKAVPVIEDDHNAALLQIAQEQGAGLVVIDTLARAMLGHSENDTTEMGKLVAAAELLRSELKCVVLFIHHSNLGAEKRMRGNGSLKGGIESEFFLGEDIDDENLRNLICKRQKDAALSPQFNFYLRSVEDSLVPSKYKFTQRPN